MLLLPPGWHFRSWRGATSSGSPTQVRSLYYSESQHPACCLHTTVMVSKHDVMPGRLCLSRETVAPCQQGLLSSPCIRNYVRKEGMRGQ